MDLKFICLFALADFFIVGTKAANNAGNIYKLANSAWGVNYKVTGFFNRWLYFIQYFPGYSCQDLYDGGYEEFHNYDKYCYESKIDSQLFCIGNYGGRIVECTDLNKGIQFVFDDGRSNPMRFNKMGESECQNYHPDYLENLAWSLGYSNYRVDGKKSGNGCRQVSLDSCGKFNVIREGGSRAGRVELPINVTFWGSFLSK